MKFVVGARLEMVSQKIDKVSLNIEDFRVTTMTQIGATRLTSEARYLAGSVHQKIVCTRHSTVRLAASSSN